MTWADIFVALDAPFVLPALSSSLVFVWKAARSAEAVVRSAWPKTCDVP
ncbi:MULTISPECIES: hypothetical protein [Methylobacterium]|nr:MULTISPECIES: hypothetical protein [Methylobacterium]